MAENVKTHHTKPLCNGLEASHVQYNSESHLAHMQSYVPAASPLIDREWPSFYMSSFKWFFLPVIIQVVLNWYASDF